MLHISFSIQFYDSFTLTFNFSADIRTVCFVKIFAGFISFPRSILSFLLLLFASFSSGAPCSILLPKVSFLTVYWPCAALSSVVSEALGDLRAFPPCHPHFHRLYPVGWYHQHRISCCSLLRGREHPRLEAPQRWALHLIEPVPLPVSQPCWARLVRTVFGDRPNFQSGLSDLL